MNSGRDTIYFISDSHFGLAADEHEREARFAALAGVMRERASHLFILGDLFDFWIEYRRAIRPDYFPILYTLRGLVDVGVEVRYLTGNHDFAIGQFLEKTIGITVDRKPLNIELQGRKVHMRHGDNILRAGLSSILLRNKSLQSIYKILHPDIGVAIGTYLSMSSRKKHIGLEIRESDLQRYRNAAQRVIKNHGSDLVIFAHTHHAELVRLDGGEYCNTGSWMDHHNYATLVNGNISLHKWDGSDN